MKQLRLAFMGLLALALLPLAALAQTSPQWPQGYVPTPQQWSGVFAAKQDYLGTSGSGALARVNGATFTAPNLGVPASVDLANAINVPVAQAIGILGAAHGGTSCSAASGACLDNITGFAANGFIQRTGAGTYAQVLPSGSGQVCLTTSCGMVTPNMASPAWTGTATGAALNLSGTLTLSGGLNAGGVLGTNGQVLTTTGAGVQWSSVGAGTVTSVQASGATTGLTFSGGPITGAGTLTLGGTLQTGFGGTSCNLPSGTCLDNITSFSGTGFVSRTGAGAYSFTAATGTGSVVQATSPTIVTPTLTTPTANQGTFNQPSIKGVTNGSNACAGCIGEFLQVQVGQGSAVSLTNATGINLTSLSLTAGDWDIWGNECLNPGGGTNWTFTQAGFSTTSNAVPAPPNGGGYAAGTNAVVTSANTCLPVGVFRLSISATTTVYLVGYAQFSGGTLTGYGSIQARRVY